ncbi:MAG: hypothetical protein JJT90_17775 [Ectothiorhodospiraceae bacterium]|nr:hypothetical protein [Ectothiorhodospiraceae bacterium]
MSIVGSWKLTMKTPFGVQTPTLVINEDNSGQLEGSNGAAQLEDLKVDGNTASFSADIPTPMGKFKVSFTAEAGGDTLTGSFKTMMGSTEFTGERL